MGRKGQQQRARQTFPDEFAHIFFVGKRITKLSLGDDPCDPDCVLFPDGFVKPVEGSVLVGGRFGFLARHIALVHERALVGSRKVAGGQLDDDERDHADADQQWNAGQQAAYNITDHAQAPRLVRKEKRTSQRQPLRFSFLERSYFPLNGLCGYWPGPTTQTAPSVW